MTHPTFLRWAAGWSKSIVRAGPKNPRCGSVSARISMTSSKPTPRSTRKKHGFLKPVVEEGVNKDLDCGDLTKDLLQEVHAAGVFMQ